MDDSKLLEVQRLWEEFQKMEGRRHHSIDNWPLLWALYYAEHRKEPQEENTELFTAKELPECNCGSIGFSSTNFHKTDCARRKQFEENCMITHPYYRAGYERGRSL